MEALEKALAIGGAVSVAVFATGEAGDGVVFSAGAHEAGAGEASAAGALAGAAASLVRFADPDDELHDVLLTTRTAFHVLRALAPDRVALLTLSRGVANLALARREFKTITDRATGPPVGPVAAPAGTPAVAPPPGTSGSALPRRDAGRHQAPSEPATDGVLSGWLAIAGQPFATDDDVLDRIIGTLRLL